MYNTFDGKMTYWADNIKFVKDIIDSKYKKIDDAIADVRALSSDSIERIWTASG